MARQDLWREEKCKRERELQMTHICRNTRRLQVITKNPVRTVFPRVWPPLMHQKPMPRDAFR